ncbi:hypothetical protein CANARDRAFT_27859 [[Candida] arabinofermentans NRRL YB-2248]|uniref:Guanine nucleotide-binding protein subunit gamma n=1 Tax=[Candida] arabinofermentans NRRL YB-2248 TaxID=983967 RepID=A0A1E4T200_9ASCO|nr:hypothetical protein CANARDRAFT_27859 [[Candida] arabinofermentans NRRL YB-2248]
MSSNNNDEGGDADRGKMLRILQLNKMKSMKLERLNQYNQRLKTELGRERVNVSNSSLLIIKYTENTWDYLVPVIWGALPPEKNRYQRGQVKTLRKEDGSNEGCCVIV